MENFKYIKNIADGVGTIHLYKAIGDSKDNAGNIVSGISGSSFCAEMNWLQDNCEKINVRINSIGGSVLEGYSIVSSILNSKVPCETYIDGIAASIAGVIAVSGKKCNMMDYGTLMLHNPSGGEDKVLSVVKDTLVTVLSNRTNRTREEISVMMDKETWLTATEAKELGMIDNIIPSNKSIKLSKNLASMANVYNSLLSEEKPQNKMKTISNKLNLGDNAQESDVILAIDKLVNKNTALEAEVASLLKEKADNEKAAKDALSNKAIALVNNAVEKRLIKDEEKAKYTSLASSSEDAFVTVQDLFSKINPVKEAAVIFDAANVLNAKGEKEDRSKWTLRDWEIKDEKGLMDMYKNNRTSYDSLYNLYYKKQA